ncbi:MAG TPA: hypothetical protein VK462_01395 [Nitrososphaeraceae archaeon]|nr:hypothetical protein [Nitrososphaeraceae archaeon]
MEISQERYFDYAIPALLSLFTGLFIFNKDVDIKQSLERIDPGQAARLGYLLLLISFSFDVIGVLLPALSSLLSFTSYLKYLAAFCFLFTHSKFNYVLIVFIFSQLGIQVLTGGVFIDLFIWCTYLFFFISLKFQFNLLLRFTFILIAAPVLFFVQSVKTEYRAATWVKSREAGLDLFVELAGKQRQQDLNKPFSQSYAVVSTIGRLTQGWHLGLTLKQVPAKVPFAEGEDMLTDISSSILPRVIFTDKKIVGSQDKFNKYTGHKLRGNTSMTIGILGDFYINFGFWGSMIMLFVFGAMIARLLYYFLIYYVLTDPINIIWVPYMLSYLIRANNDFYMVFNSITKGFLIFLFINFVRKKLWPTMYV